MYRLNLAASFRKVCRLTSGRLSMPAGAGGRTRILCFLRALEVVISPVGAATMDVADTDGLASAPVAFPMEL